MVAGPDGLPASHSLYEKFRELAPGDPGYADLKDLLTRVWDGTTIPSGDPFIPGIARDAAAAIQWPAADLSSTGIEDAASAWTGHHYADIRQFMFDGTIREGMSVAEDPIHGISLERAAQATSTLTQAIANGTTAPELYRGLSLDPTAYERFSNLLAGDNLDMSVSSWSSSAKEAATYTGRRGIEDEPAILNVVGATGFDIAPYSHYPDEAEWITDGAFEVVKVEKVDGVLHVTLRQTGVWSAPVPGLL